MTYLYATSFAYGVGAGITLDTLLGVHDPALAVIAPLTLGAGVPLAAYAVDRMAPFHRGVASSTATGTLLGGLTGALLSSTQYAYAPTSKSEWSAGGYSLVTLLGATAGGVGGYVYGEYVRPDPKKLTFIASGAGIGAISGGLIGAGASGKGDAGRDGTLGSLIGFGAGTGLASALAWSYQPSWASQKAMWIGYGVGVGVTSLVYTAYLFTDGDPKRGMIANAVGGLAGMTLGALFTSNSRDDDTSASASKTPGVSLSFSPTTGGGTLHAAGSF